MASGVFPCNFLMSSEFSFVFLILITTGACLAPEAQWVQVKDLHYVKEGYLEWKAPVRFSCLCCRNSGKFMYLPGSQSVHAG